jgi:hypothetical protein
MKQQHTSPLEDAINDKTMNNLKHENTLKQHQVHYMTTRGINGVQTTSSPLHDYIGNTAILENFVKGSS